MVSEQVAPSSAAPMTAAAAVRTGADRRRITWGDAAVILGFVAAAVAILGPLWWDIERRYLVNSMRDQHMWEWFFAVTAHAVAEGGLPLWSDLQNHPLGVNLMANTAMFGLGVPLAPLTWAFGPTATFAVALTGGLAGTAAAWYWVFSRSLVRSRTAAAVGGGLCGFAPPMVSHANAHPNFVAFFVLPFIVLLLIRLARGARPMRDGLVLGLLVAWQIFLGEEPLLLAGTAIGLFGICYAAVRPGEVRAMLPPLTTGLTVGAGVAAVLVAYPLWIQFFGPQSYLSLGHGETGNDLLALTGFATESLAGSPGEPGTGAARFAANPTEENAYFGLPLVLLTVVLGAWLWRVPVARASSITALVLAWISLGTTVRVNGTDTGIPGPWALLANAPLFESVVVSRFTMACIPFVAVLLALATDRVLDGASAERVPSRPVWLLVLAAALLPIVPTPLHAIERTPTPKFYTDGGWRKFAEHGGSVVSVPLASPHDSVPLRWQIDADLGFPIAEGYFVGPNGGDRHGRYGPVRRPTSELLETVATTGVIARVDQGDRDAAAADLRFWRADVVVLRPHPHEDALRATVAALLGEPGGEVGGVWVWDVQPS